LSIYIILRYVSGGLQIPFLSNVPVTVYAQESGMPAPINEQVQMLSQVERVQITGRVHDADTGERLTDSDVYLYQKVAGTWVLWPGQEYDNQRNPQKLDVYSEYSFYVSPGDYYVRVKADGYYSVDTKELSAQNQPVRVNVELKKASAVWTLLLGMGVITFIIASVVITIRYIYIWNKKRVIKTMVLKHAQEAIKERDQSGGQVAKSSDTQTPAADTE